MARRKASRSPRPRRAPRKKTAATLRSAKRPSARGGARKVAARPAAARRKPGKARRPAPRNAASAAPEKVPRLDRARKILDDDAVLPTPPSSLNMDRKGSAARTGRAELDQNRRDHRSMTPEITGGDIDVDVEDAYFTGEEAPGGDNPTPDQDVVDDIGRALGVEYEDNEELKSSDKVSQRDKHRWELDPASSEDYKDRD